ncbi:hypothetical protein TVAG_138640 [Trichomonas vaginalis G3]|uniref:USP domain-containing protein n=1 Tax=Trichomonas vaginalis (strain ATCC PRA-98 / G3) TaxID=412133 RepID=A2GLL2_TRIV3|nr:hypothetical protein TVAG_138640 [Trichomonas vaginalis G3]|eukprot:XP_001294886.1 hypothetical protein [Trichomonas vaginalis G3]
MCTDDSHINEISTFLWVDVQRNWSDPNVFFDKFEIKKNYKTQLSEGTYVFKIHSIIAYHQGHFVAFVNKGRVWFMLDDEITYIVPDGLIKVSIHIMCTEALRASLHLICEFDTLQNR